MSTIKQESKNCKIEIKIPESMSRFLDEIDCDTDVTVSKEAILQLIKFLGGVDEFLRVCNDTVRYSSSEGVAGLLFADERIEFYLDNQAQMLSFIQSKAKKSDRKDVSDFILHYVNHTPNIKDHYSESDVNKALHSTHDDWADIPNVKNDICSFVVHSFIDEVCDLYRQRVMLSF